MTAYPNPSWGIRAKVNPTKRTYVMGGVYNGDTSPRDTNDHGANMSMHGPAFAIGEAAYQANGLPGDTGLIGNYKVGFWYDDNRYVDFNSVGPGLSPSEKRGNWGAYLLFDQVLVQFGARDENRGLGRVASFLVSPDESISQMPYFLTAGVVARGIVPSRPRDVAGFGLGYGHFSSDLRSSQRRQQVGEQEYELALDWTYRISFLDNAFYFQPDAQYIIRPGGTGQINNAFTVGFQTGVNF